MRSRPTEAEWLATLTKNYGEAKATALVAALKKAHPEKSIRTLSYMCSGPGVEHPRHAQQRREDGHDEVQPEGARRCSRGTSPGSRRCWKNAGAWHTAELAFCFDNTKLAEQGTGNGPEAQALAKKMAGAWATFARTGNPSQPDLAWAAFDPAKGNTMVFDNKCRMVDDPEGEVRKILLTLAAEPPDARATARGGIDPALCGRHPLQEMRTCRNPSQEALASRSLVALARSRRDSPRRVAQPPSAVSRFRRRCGARQRAGGAGASVAVQLLERAVSAD